MKQSEREDALTTLAIAALIHDTNEAVVNTAKRLAEHVDRGVVKSLLAPLIASECPKLVVLTAINRVSKMQIGTATCLGVEHTIIVCCRGRVRYEIEEVVNGVASYFSKTGIVNGEVELSFLHFFKRHTRTSVLRFTSGVHGIAMTDDVILQPTA